jgi:glycosyltransferase involved in cell wall biosynthesis
MACGTPVVSVANAGAREVVQHHYDGLLGTEDTLGEMLVRMLTDEGLRRRIADNGLRSVKRFDMTRVAGEYLSLYANLVRTHT